MKFKKDISLSTDDFWYDLIDGSYINPEEILEDNDDIDKIKKAIDTLKRFKFEMEEKGIIEYN